MIFDKEVPSRSTKYGRRILQTEWEGRWNLFFLVLPKTIAVTEVARVSLLLPPNRHHLYLTPTLSKGQGNKTYRDKVNKNKKSSRLICKPSSRWVIRVSIRFITRTGMRPLQPSRTMDGPNFQMKYLPFISREKVHAPRCPNGAPAQSGSDLQLSPYRSTSRYRVLETLVGHYSWLRMPCESFSVLGQLGVVIYLN